MMRLSMHGSHHASLLLAACSVLAALTLTAAAAEVPSTDVDLSPTLRAADERLAAVHSLRASFEQEKRIALLKRPLTSRGTVSMQNGKVLWQTESPRPSSMLVDDGEIRMYDPEAGRVEVYRVEERFSDMAASPVPRLDVLAKSFEIEEVEEPGALVLRLAPRTDLLRDQLAEATLSLDAELGYVKEIEIVDQDGDRTTIRFTHVEVNPELDPGALTLDVPPDTEVVMPQGDAS